MQASSLTAFCRQTHTNRIYAALVRQNGAFMEKAYLVLSDGTVFEGVPFGARVGAAGELVFTTGVVGYLETLTDAAYAGQIVVQTFPLIGNYGVITEDLQGSVHPAGYVVREICDAPNNFRCEGTLDAYLKREGVPGICGVDTRALTRHLREHGTMNAVITDAIPADPVKIGACTVPAMSASARTETEVFGTGKHRVTLIDYGCGAQLIPALTARGCTVTAVPYNTSAETILAAKPDGVVLSGGAGDPAENTAAIAEIAALAGKVPLFGVGLGHQMLAIALGAKTEKMHHGHRGGQPVRDLAGSRSYTTSQNHGYTVVSESVKNGVVRYVNVNDRSCEGIDYPDKKAFSVQFDPASSQDMGLLFDRFICMMGGED